MFTKVKHTYNELMYEALGFTDEHDSAMAEIGEDPIARDACIRWSAKVYMDGLLKGMFYGAVACGIWFGIAALICRRK